MKTSILIFLMMLPIKAIAPVDNSIYIFQRGIDPIEVLWNAICDVESNSNPWEFIIDTNGRYSVGIAMIQQSRVNHFNKLTGKDYTLGDCFNPAVSKEIFMRFATEDIERTAKKWNGSGPKTERYWKLIKARL